MLFRLTLAATLIAGPALALDDPQTQIEDPLRSGMWDYLWFSCEWDELHREFIL